MVGHRIILSAGLRAVAPRCSGAIHASLIRTAPDVAGRKPNLMRTAKTLRHITAGLCGVAAFATPLSAQTSSAAESWPVVQPLPPAGAADLNQALQQLARNSRDVDALINAGNASLRLNDIDAAIGFFGRADELSPGNPRIKVGLAGAFVRSERPIEALRLFDDAERAGASTAALAEDRGLAYDLVGDPVSAQAQYASAMAVRSSDELIRRMALSQAISGDRQAFEKTLYPLMERRDFAAYRTRAFAMAILGEEDEAVAIAKAVMPREMSARMTPYLRYMQRLTKAQQAAAANLGIFPRAAQIGRDDPRIAQYSGAASSARSVRTADAGLAPQGQPLGPVVSDVASPRRRPGRDRSAVPTVAAAPSPSPLTSSPTLARNELPAVQPGSALAATIEAQRPSFKPVSAPVESVAIVQQLPEPTAPPAPPPAEEPVSVADAFAGFTLTSVAPDKSGAVDISSIKPKREIAPKPEPEPAAKVVPPKNPSRVWVQVATGRDRKALAFDWRRISRKVPDVLGSKKVQPYVTNWGQTNRLLAGPFDDRKAAQNAVTELKADGIDSFMFVSAAGQEIEDLP
jgi:tetratricopeptide (TPR) repeat protein